jgi:tetrapyrrole methylase family protein/MazG family protein
LGLLTIVGLGPGGADLLTREAHDVIVAAVELYVRTRKHPTVAELPFRGRLHSFDEVYRRAATIDDVYETIAARLVRLARRPGGVVYAVPGHPLVGERSVQLALARAREHGVATRVIAGLSFVEPTLSAAGVDPVACGLQLLDAGSVVADYFGAGGGRQPFAERSRWVDATQLALIAQLDSPRLAAGLKLALLESYPPDHAVVLVRAGQAERLSLVGLDRAPVDHLTSLVVPPLARLEDMVSFETLRYVVARLRAPGGCPWDREQTHETLKRELLEEAYEAVDAIERGSVSGDWTNLAEELGDVLMNVLLHTQIAAEDQRFWLEDVLRGINTKLIRRHPHVFGDVSVSSTADVLANWDRIKRAEKGERDDASRLGEVPAALPALIRAQALQRRATRTGFTWPSIDGVWAKLEEEIGEVREAGTDAERADEVGDVLWMAAELANWLQVDAEEALRRATDRFVARFRAMERLAAERAERFEELGVERQIELWQAVKDTERSAG